MITRYRLGLTLFLILPVMRQTWEVNADNSFRQVSTNRSGRKVSGKSHNEFYGNDRTLFPSSYYEDDDKNGRWERIDQTGLDERAGVAEPQGKRSLFGGTEVVGGSYSDSVQEQVEGLAEARPEDVLEVVDAMKPFFQKHMTKMLIAYKIKFFLLIPVLVGGLLLIIGSSSLAGLFFAMFVIGLWSRG